MVVALAVQLLGAREMEEGRGDVITAGELAAFDLFPRLLVVRNVVPEPKLPSADGVKHPARPALHARWDHVRPGAAPVQATGEVL